MADGNAYKADTAYYEVSGVIQGLHYYKSVSSLSMHIELLETITTSGIYWKPGF